MNIELNACMGGTSEGFRRAGIHFNMAVDYDEDACDSHERNIGLRPIQIDIRDPADPSGLHRTVTRVCGQAILADEITLGVGHPTEAA